MDFLNPDSQTFPAFCSPARNSFEPLVVAAVDDFGQSAHHEVGKRVFVFSNEGVLYFDSFAKYAAAFLRNQVPFEGGCFPS